MSALIVRFFSMLKSAHPERFLGSLLPKITHFTDDNLEFIGWCINFSRVNHKDDREWDRKHPPRLEQSPRPVRNDSPRPPRGTESPRPRERAGSTSSTSSRHSHYEREREREHRRGGGVRNDSSSSRHKDRERERDRDRHYDRERERNRSPWESRSSRVSLICIV